MGELWRDLVELLRRRPLLWIPVLLADLLGYLVNLGKAALISLIVMHQTAARSVLGGGVVHGPMTASAMQSATVTALLLSWVSYFLRALLYSLALLAVAALVAAYRERAPQPSAAIVPAVAQGRGAALDLALRSVAIYAIAALLVGWLSSTFTKHGNAAVLHTFWFNLALDLVLLLTLSATLAPVALRLLAGRTPNQDLARMAQAFAFILAAVTTALTGFVTANGRELGQVPSLARYPLEMTGSLVVALPYVLLFVGLSLLARRVRLSDEEPPVD